MPTTGRRARSAVSRAGAAAAGCAFRHRRRAIPAAISPGPTTSSSPPCAARRASAVLCFGAADAECHAASDGGARLVPVGPAVRGGRLRRADHQRLVGGPRRVLRARARNPDRPDDRGRPGGARSAAMPSSTAIGAAARERTLADHTAGARRELIELSRRCCRGIPSREWRLSDVGHRAGRRQRHAHSAAGVLEGTAAGRQPLRRRDRAPARRQRISDRAHAAAPAPTRSALSSRRWKSDILQYYGGAIGKAAIAYVVQPEPAGLCDAIFRALPLIHRRRAGAGRPARYDLVAGGRASAACRTTGSPF